MYKNDLKNINQEEIERALKPTNDYIFKKIYGSVGSEKITEEFIRAFLDLDIEIESIDTKKDAKTYIIDEEIGKFNVIATMKDGGKIDLEIQVGSYENIEEKLAKNGVNLFAKTNKNEIQFGSVKKVISVMIILDDYKKSDKYKEYEKQNKYRLKWNLMEENHHGLILTDKLEMYIISLNKIKSQIERGIINDKEKIAVWTKFLLNPKNLTEVEMQENSEIKEANKKYNDFIKNEYERENAFKRYEFLLKINYIKQSGIDEGYIKGIKRGKYIGIKEGKLFGLKRGLECGIEEGFEQGMDQGVKQGTKIREIEIAQKMLNKNIEIELIVEITGLTKEEIEKLK